MKLLELLTGGRPFVNDDLAILQAEIYKAIGAVAQSPFTTNMVIQNCQISGGGNPYNIAAGFVVIDGVILELDAQSFTAPATIVKAADTLGDFANYQTGGSKATTRLQKAEIVPGLVGGGIQINDAGASTKAFDYFDYLANNFVRRSGDQTVNGVKSFRQNIIADQQVIAAGNVSGDAGIFGGRVEAGTGVGFTNRGNGFGFRFAPWLFSTPTWNMDVNAAAYQNVPDPFGGGFLPWSRKNEIASTEVSIPQSAAGEVRPLLMAGQWRIINNNGTAQIELTRDDGGVFDQPTFNSVSPSILMWFRQT